MDIGFSFESYVKTKITSVDTKIKMLGYITGLSNCVVSR